MMAAKKAVITKWGAADIGAEPQKIGLTGSPTQVKRIFAPPSRPGGEKLEGSPESIAQSLVDKLKALQLV
jgi:electron transfer flavoprotein beta subunit